MKYLKSSWKHLGMALIALVLAYFFNQTEKNWESVIVITFISYVAGYKIEAYQERRQKIITNEYIKYSNVDVLVTTIAGFLGALLYYLYI